MPTKIVLTLTTLTTLTVLAACSSSSGPAAISSSGPDTVPLTAQAAAAPVTSWSAWPQAGHDGQRTGTSAAQGPTTGAVRWTRRLEGNVTPGPVVGVDGTIIAASNAGVLHGLDPATGQDRWTFDGKGTYGIDLSTSPAVLKDGTILWPGPHSTLFALSPTGAEQWTQDLGGQGTSPAVAPDGQTVVIGTQAGRVLSLKVSGADHPVLWTTEVGGTSYGSVSLDPRDPTIAYDTTDSSLVALHAGKVAWRFATKSQVEVSAAVAPDGTIVVGSNDDYEYGLHPSGKLAWRYAKGAQTYSSPIVGPDGIAWFGDHRAFVTGLVAATGKRVARFRGEATQPPHGPSVGVWSDVVVDSAHDVYWGTRLGHIYGESAAGKRLFDLDAQATIDGYPALTTDGLLVVGTTDGMLRGIADT